MAIEVSVFGVVGAGVMGRGIAEVAALKGGFKKVVLHDSVPQQLLVALKAITGDLTVLAQKGKLSAEEKDRTVERIVTTTDLSQLADCQFIIEAVSEEIDVKSEVLRCLARLLRPDARIASNTSSIPITRLASFSHDPANFIGLHFMNPAAKMKGVEIIKGLRTSAETWQLALSLARRFEKEVTASKDKAGFVVNRLLIPMLNDAARSVASGAATEAIDAYFTRDKAGPRHRMGPLMLADLIGLDTVCRILLVLEAELGLPYAACSLLKELVSRGVLGAKSGSGFYAWRSGRPGSPNALVRELGQPATASESNVATVAKRTWLLMANEAVKILEEGVSTAGDIERGCIFCLNHPEGVLAALDSGGLDTACRELLVFEAQDGPVYKPAPLLRRLAEAGCTGKTAGSGIFAWDAAGAYRGLNPALAEYLG